MSESELARRVAELERQRRQDREARELAAWIAGTAAVVLLIKRLQS